MIDDPSGQISIGGDAKNSVIIHGTNNTVVFQSTQEMGDVLKRRELAPDSMVEGINGLFDNYYQRIYNFIKEYLGDEQRPIPFGGRDADLSLLSDWLTGSKPYLLLAAPAGRGKSALLVRWLDSLRTHNDLALAFVPVSIRFGTNMKHFFYATLAARLAFLHGDQVPTSSTTSTDVYRGLVSDYLSKPLANGKTLLVVLDGLDEAADWQAGADFLPASPPTGVHIIISARGEPNDWLRHLNWGNHRAAVLDLHPLTPDGLRDVLYKMGCPFDELSRDVDIVAELFHLSQGDPLLVRLYVDDLWAKGDEVTRLKPKDLENIQPGYKGYFDNWWEDQEKLWGQDTPLMRPHVQMLLNLLTCALSGLMREDLMRLAPQEELTRFTLDNALKTIQRFVIGDGIKQGYTFSHPKLGQFFWESLTSPEQTKVEDRFLAWCKETCDELVTGKRNPKNKKDVPVYVVQNYGAHLTRAERSIEDWLPLIHKQAWAQAWFSVEGAYGGYLQDVERVWNQCKVLDQHFIKKTAKTPYLSQQVRCGLITSSIHSVAANISPDIIPILVWNSVWTFPQAWAFIRQMPQSSHKARAIRALLPIMADYQLTIALQEAQLIDDEGIRAVLLSELVQRLPDKAMPQLLKAELAIKKYEGASRTKVLGVLAQRLPDEYLDQILEAARAIKDDGARAGVLSILTQRLPTVANEALEVTRTIKSDGIRAEVLGTLAQHLPSLADEALGVAQAIEDEQLRARVLITLSQRLPDEYLGQILREARTVKGDVAHANVLSALVQRLPAIADEALKAARVIWFDSFRAGVLSNLAQRLPDEYLSQVLEEARATKDNESRAEILSALVQRLPVIADEVLEVTRTIKDNDTHVKVLIALAQRLPNEYLGQILEAAKAIKSDWSRAEVLSALVQRLPAVANGTLQMARMTQDEWLRTEVLSARAQSQQGTSCDALYAQVIGDEVSSTKVLVALTQRLPDEYLKDLLEVVRATKDKDGCANVLVSMAQRLPDEHLGQVLEAAQTTIEGENAYADVLSIVSQRFPDKYLSDVLETAQAIEYDWEWKRIRILIALVQRLPNEYLGQVLEVAKAIKSDWSRAEVLSALVQRLPAVADDVLKAARAIHDDERRAKVLTALIQCLPIAADDALKAARAIHDDERRAKALTALVQSLPVVGEEALIAARAIDDNETRAEVLSTLAQQLSTAADDAFATVQVILHDKWPRMRVLITLAQQLPDEYLVQLLEIAREIQDEEARAKVLIALTQRLPDEYLEQLLEVTRTIGEKWKYTDVLIHLAHRMPKLTIESLKVARAIRDETTRVYMLGNLIKPMLDISLVECYFNLEDTLSVIAQRTRIELFSDISVIIPIILKLGSDDAAHEIYHAVHDVTTWWP